MSAVQAELKSTEERPPFWLGEPFWDRLNRIEARPRLEGRRGVPEQPHGRYQRPT